MHSFKLKKVNIRKDSLILLQPVLHIDFLSLWPREREKGLKIDSTGVMSRQRKQRGHDGERQRDSLTLVETQTVTESGRKTVSNE